MAHLQPKLTPVDEDLNQFEKDLRLFKIEFEQYFGGGRPRPPVDTEWRIEQVIKKYGERPAEISFAQRFRFGTLAQTYAKFRDRFRKRLKQKEEGIVQHHYGAAARAVDAERKRRQGGRRAATPEPALAVHLTDPTREIREVERLFLAYRQAQRKTGSVLKQIKREQFLDFVLRKTAELLEGKAGPIEYSVVVEDGKARIKARVKK